MCQQPIPAHRQHFPRFRMVPIKERAARTEPLSLCMMRYSMCYDATDYYFLVRTILAAENQALPENWPPLV